MRKNNFPTVGNRKNVGLDKWEYMDFWAQHTGQYKQNPPWTKQRGPSQKNLVLSYLVFLVAKGDTGAVLIPAARLKPEGASAVMLHATQNSTKVLPEVNNGRKVDFAK